ncbi:pimeloyl-ACP methyl ester carboxylesterase [Streptomyces sp. 846.5]|nr:alpha/beta hydrolase [Streptomyces sp. 846.5]TDT98251.1 pimeloyl-ACP methyl ester carboxylesterase [Streptomyces sp. 846.5]
MPTYRPGRPRPHHRLLILLTAALLSTAALLGITLSASAADPAHRITASAPAAVKGSAAHTPHSHAPACFDPEKPLSPGYDTATKNDTAFNNDFRHCFTTVDGVQMHYVIGGHGPQAMVLLHGWPESWYEFRGIMPSLLPGRTVIAVDLPGLGDSTGNPTDYTKKTLATYTHALLDKIGYRQHVQVVAHDFGVGVAYSLATQYRTQTSGLFLMDFPLVGKNLTFAAIEPLDWQFSLNLQDPLAEQLVTGRVSQYLTYFYPTQSHVAHPVPTDEVNEYIRVYNRTQVLHAGFELYRTWTQDQADNAKLETTPLTVPVRLLTQDGFAPLLLSAVQDAAPAATGTDIKGAGHWLLDEAPQRVLSEINTFYPAH